MITKGRLRESVAGLSPFMVFSETRSPQAELSSTGNAPRRARRSPIPANRENTMPSINKSRILIMATHGFEQSELVKPLEQLKAKGARVEIAAPEAGQINGWQNNDWGTPVDVDLTLDAVQVGDYDALVLPGGVMNPDKLRINDKALGHRQSLCGIRQSRRRHLSCAVAAGRNRRRQGTRSHVVHLHPHRRRQCWRPLGRQAGGDRQGHRHLAPSRATSTPSSPRSSRRSRRGCTAAPPDRHRMTRRSPPVRRFATKRPLSLH